MSVLLGYIEDCKIWGEKDEEEKSYREAKS